MNSGAIQYHNSVLRLIQVEPRISSHALGAIAERERQCGTVFPAAVKEWFSIEGVAKLFQQNTNADNLESLEELGRLYETVHGYLRVATENQEVVGW